MQKGGLPSFIGFGFARESRGREPEGAGRRPVQIEAGGGFLATKCRDFEQDEGETAPGHP